MNELDKNTDSLITLFETKKSLTITLLRAREALMMSFRPMLAKHNFTEQQWRVLRVLGELLLIFLRVFFSVRIKLGG